MKSFNGFLYRKPMSPPGVLAQLHARLALSTAQPVSEPSQPGARPLDDMPAPRGLPWIGTTLSLLLAGGPRKLHEYVDRRHKELGPIFRDRIGPVTAVFVADPTEMRRVFALEGKYPMHILPEAWILYNQMTGRKRGILFMDGEEWLNTRRIMNNLMIKPDRSFTFGPPCQASADKLTASLGTYIHGAFIPALEKKLYKWSLQTVIATLMGSQYGMHGSKWNDQVESLSAVVHEVFLESGRLSIISAKRAQDLELPVWKRFVNAVDNTLNEATTLVQQIHKLCATGAQDGLLPQLLQAGISDEDIVRIVVDLIIAAGDTTALSMQWALYLLAKHPNVQEEVLKDVLQNEDVSHSLLLQGVVREALRLYPVAPFLTRFLPNSCVVGGYELPPMQLVLLSLYSSGRDPSNFSEPDCFWPGRWLRRKENNIDGNLKPVRNSFASMPFAMGARSCVGRKLAEMQMMTALAAILKKYKLNLIKKHNIEMVLHLVSVPSRPIEISIERR